MIVLIVVSITQQLKFTIFDRFQLAARFGLQQNQQSVVVYYCYTHCTADFIKKIDFVQRASSVFLNFISIRMYNALRVKSMFLIKSAIQFNNNMTDSVVALYGDISTSLTPRQHSYLHKC